MWDRGAALTSTLHWFETELLTQETNLVGLRAVNREVLAQAEMATRADRIVLDMDSSESPVHGAQEGSAYNGHFESVCYHPLFLFTEHGDCLAATLRPGTVHSADDWDDLLVPEIDRQPAAGTRVAFRADAAFAKPEIYDALEQRGVDYAIRMPANKSLELKIEEILFPSAGTAELHALGALQEFPLSGEELDHAQTDCLQGGAPPGRAVPSRRLRRDQHGPPEPLGRPVLQQARHGGAMDQRRHAGDALDGGCRAIGSGRTKCACN